MDRRKFIRSSGFSMGMALTLPATLSSCNKADSTTANTTPIFTDISTWEGVRALFPLDNSHVQMAQMLLASHPAPVAEAIEKHRKAFDNNPAMYWEENFMTAELKVCDAAAKYMGVTAAEIALTDSTTMGTSLLFNGMKLRPGDEILATTHDHYVTDKSIEYTCKKKGASYRRVEEYQDPRTVTVDEVVGNIKKAISDKTRVVMVTWVHSSTGVKLPIAEIAEAIKEVNKGRIEDNHIYFAVDGVHGFGNQDKDIAELGCDFFSAGTHKWIFGPRGTGILYAKREAWNFIEPTIPAFSEYPFLEYLGNPPEREPTFHELMTPGGFHSFDFRWALHTAFELQMEMKRDRVHQRTTELSTHVKEGIRNIPGVDLITPLDPNMSAGINCFMVNSLEADETVRRFHDMGVIASSSPYRQSFARLTPFVGNTMDEVDRSLEVLAKIAKV
ncbi:aminotransferase class V-fold PLP-dependent enzyme [Echinicola sp. CAU 1574]|uniref:Aminotransferase class V-fold PLP-dependent enzyme n=1 Tax=Echinicola arenosa TaxID=2774144 RepID=A0ABR9AHP3_9BACT|nr:aminotransferase class V-fold PLP-dependent enzyme [Echinicola arenosa]MBD8487460.1 aminotransferase class V-fold PLP-dependent enzyme [Echinicola arenosa]